MQQLNGATHLYHGYMWAIIALLVTASAADRDIYLGAVQGNGDAARQAEERWKALADQDPNSAIPQAYVGSLKLLESGRTLAVWRRGKLAKEGLQALDAAVAKAPENLEVRYIRAISTWHLPGFFKREQQCSDDFAWLATRALKGASTDLDPRYAASALYHHGLFLEKRGDAKTAASMFQAAVSAAPSSHAAAEARKKLNTR